MTTPLQHLSYFFLLTPPIHTIGPEKLTVLLDPRGDYLEGGTVLDRLGLWYHTRLSVFICRSCKIALTSGMLKGHLRAQHTHAVAGKDLGDLAALTQHYQVYSHPEDVPLPSPGGPAVQGLHAPQPGFACHITGCTYASKSEEVMKKHHRTDHHLGRLYDKQYRPCAIQALFNSIGKVFFEVRDILPNENDIAILQAALMDVGTSCNDGTAVIATDKDRTPPALLRVTGWGDYLPQVRASRTLRERALALKDRLKADELGSILQVLPAAVNGLFKLGRTLLDGHSSKLTALKVIIHGANIPSEG